MVTRVENDAAAVATSGLSLYRLHEPSTRTPPSPLRANDERDQTAIEIVVLDEAADMHRGQPNHTVVDLRHEDRRSFASESLKPFSHLQGSRRVAKLPKKQTDLGGVSLHELTNLNRRLADQSIICSRRFLTDDDLLTCARVLSPEVREATCISRCLSDARATLGHRSAKCRLLREVRHPASGRQLEPAPCAFFASTFMASQTTGRSRESRRDRTASWYEQLREQYRPQHLRILLVAESPPDPGDGERRFFYSPLLTYDNLYRGVAQAVYGERPDVNVRDKPRVLGLLRDDGFWLIDAVEHPINKTTRTLRRAALKRPFPA